MFSLAPGVLPPPLFRPSLDCSASKSKAKSRKNGLVRATTTSSNDREDDDDDLLFHAAALRIQETHRPEPLFVDPYASCFVPPNLMMEFKNYPHNYCLATRFIDDKLLSTMNQVDGPKQVVLLSDGMDTRPYRLRWPTSTIIFDVSPERVFRKAAEKLQAVGAKIPRGCLLRHVPLESPDIQQTLCMKGLNGNRPSIWAFQGLPVMTLASFEEIVYTVSCLAMKGCLLLGEFPRRLAGTESIARRWMGKIFTSSSFQVDYIGYNDVARVFGQKPVSEDYKDILLVAKHLRFSEAQMEIWRAEFQRVEDEGDEEGFEDV